MDLYKNNLMNPSSILPFSKGGSSLCFALLGESITQSKSPNIHQAFANQLNLKITYEKIPTTVDTLEKTLNDLQKNKYHGANITAPLKEITLQHVDQLTPRAQQAKSINTIIFKENGKRIGDNTDGIGLQNDFMRHKISLTNKKILILGAGGAVRGILPVLTNHTKMLFIHNRTFAKAQKLTHDFPSIKILNPEEMLAQHFDIVINAISTFDFPIFLKNLSLNVYYDLKYPNPSSNFNKPPQLKLNGLGMLVEQAAAAFLQWTGQHPDTNLIHNQPQTYGLNK